MLNDLLKSITTIYIAYGATDFRKQIKGLSEIIQGEHGMNPYANSTCYIFCNRKQTSIKILCYDKNGFICAQKTVMDTNKFKWPKNENELKNITKQQVSWLLDGLEINPKKYFRDVKINSDEIAI